MSTKNTYRNRHYLLTTLLLFWTSVAFSQGNYVVNIDFESSVPTFNTFGGNTYEDTDNPSQTGINTSSRVGKIVKSNTNAMGGIFVDLPSAINFSHSNTFTIKIYSPKIGAIIKFKIEDNNSGEQIEIDKTTSIANQWEELSFTFTGAVSNTYERITLFFDFNTNIPNTYYFDDIRLSGSGSTGSGEVGRCVNLVWSDEFDVDGIPNSSRWAYDVGDGCNIHPDLCGWGNQEEQYYTKRPENVRVANGKLIIEAKKENFGGRRYTSTRIVSRNKGDWLYGRIEVKAKLPKGKGTWPAIWMLPTDNTYGGWPHSGEIDIMEHVGFDLNKVHASLHTSNCNTNASACGQSTSRFVLGAVDDFHVYAIEWTKDDIRFFVDDLHYFTFFNRNQGFAQWPFDQRFHLIMNIAIGGTWGGQQGIDDSMLPQTMEVDYVRVYEFGASVELNGETFVQSNQVGVVYTATKVANANYQWSLPAGASIISGQGTNQITVNWGDTPGRVKVTLSGNLDCENQEASLDVAFFLQPEGDTFAIDDFEDNNLSQWKTDLTGANTYALAEEDGQLRVSYHITDDAAGSSVGRTFTTPVNLAAHTVMRINLRARSANVQNLRIAATLTDAAGKETSNTLFFLNPLKDDEYHTYGYDFSGAWNTVDSSKITNMRMYFNKGQDTVWFEDVNMLDGRQVPDVLTNLRASFTDNNAVDLRWDADRSNGVGYRVWHATAQDTDYSLIADNLSLAQNHFTANGQTGTNFYRVSAFNNAGNSAFSNVVDLAVTGIFQKIADEQLKVFPNPSSGTFWIQAENGLNFTKTNISLFNICGKLVAVKVLKEDTKKWKIKYSKKNVPDGIYILVLNTSEEYFYKNIIVD